MNARFSTPPPPREEPAVQSPFLLIFVAVLKFYGTVENAHVYIRELLLCACTRHNNCNMGKLIHKGVTMRGQCPIHTP